MTSDGTTRPPSIRRRVLAGLAVVLLLAIAAGAVLLRERARVYRIPILMYHKIGDAPNSLWWVAVADFESQLKDLQEQGYRSIFPSDLVAHQAWGKPLPPKPVILTFDDGYLNTLEIAEPLLRRYGFRGVCYLITSRVADNAAGRQEYDGAPLLTWPEVRAARKRGTLRFGGHSRTHANLRALGDPGDEVTGCFKDLRRKGGFTPEGFCYPNGQYKPETPALVARAGFTTAVTCDDGQAITTPDLNRFTLPRVAIIGGRHVYHVESEAATNAFAVKVWKDGHAMDVHPRLSVMSGNSAGDDGWLAPVTIDTQPKRLEWRGEKPSGGTVTLELWDAFRVLRLYRSPLPAGP